MRASCIGAARSSPLAIARATSISRFASPGLDREAEDAEVLALLETPRAAVIHHSSGGMFAIRDGKWKLVLGNGSGGRQAPRGKPFAKPYHLFDLSKDISERRNVAGEHPEIVKRLTTEFEQIHKGP